MAYSFFTNTIIHSFDWMGFEWSYGVGLFTQFQAHSMPIFTWSIMNYSHVDISSFFLNSKTCISLIKHSHHSAGLFCILITFDELLWAALSPFISKTTMPLLYPILFDTCFLRFIITKPKRNRCVFFHVQFSMHPLKCHCNVSRIVLCHSWAKSHVLKEICCLCMCVVWSGVHTVPQTNKKVHSM